ncbi:MAG: hypothetical protein GXC73_07930, partial [Chitinophagaceae bacterium]|nr:hypothetical protein [Chitinophagaceae bacterium]
MLLAKQFFLLICAQFVLLLVTAQTKQQPDKALLKTIDQNFVDAAAQYKVLAQNLPADKFPKTYFPTTGKYEFSNSGWWCSGFYPGSLLYLYQQTKDEVLYKEAQRILEVLKKEQFNTTTHDLGFMMYCSFGNANTVTSCIKSWDGKQNEYLVIIDNMMNLKLLFWATQVTGDSSFYKIAVTHANTTMKNHFRADNSSYHVLNYNAQTGAIQQKRTAQGFADESAWARGQAWGLYGYTETYRETKDKQYLVQANKIAAFILNHPNLPADKIPYWDFNAPNIPNALRDVSAATIMASALLELSGYVNKELSLKYFKAAETILKNLSTEQYKAD